MHRARRLGLGSVRNSSADLAISKVADVTSVHAAGDVVHYTITLHNTGPTDALTGVTLTESLAPISLGAGDPVESGGNPLLNHNGILDVGETWTYHATYTVAAGDLTASNGELINDISVITDQTHTLHAESVVAITPFSAAAPTGIQDPHTASYWASHLAAWDGSSGNNASMQGRSRTAISSRRTCSRRSPATAAPSTRTIMVCSMVLTSRVCWWAT